MIIGGPVEAAGHRDAWRPPTLLYPPVIIGGPVEAAQIAQLDDDE